MCTPGAFLGGRRELAQDLDHTGLQLIRYRALSHASSFCCDESVHLYMHSMFLQAATRKRKWTAA
jgi:hypothetical protein